MIRDWLPIVTGGVLVIVVSVAWAVDAWRRDRIAELDAARAWRERDERILMMRTGVNWPDDLCSFPPCETEDGFACSWHDPRGKRLRYGSPSVVATVTDLAERRRAR